LGVLPGDGDIENIKTLDKRPQSGGLKLEEKVNIRLKIFYAGHN
jgi:hypothetical protein